MANIPTGNDPLQRFLQAQSTHEALGARQEVYERLGLNKPGFWIDLKQRTLKLNPPADDMPTAAQQPTNFSDPYDNTSLNYTVDPPVKVNPVKALQMPIIPGQGAAATKSPNLQQKEKELTWSQLVSRRKSNPILGTSTLDVMTAEQNFMDADLVLQMQANPNKFLSQALLAYYNDKNSNMWMRSGNSMTNFEIITTEASLTKKKAAKQISRFDTPAAAVINEAKKTYIQQTKGGGAVKQLNVKTNGYYSMPIYMSPFGS